MGEVELKKIRYLIFLGLFVLTACTSNNSGNTDDITVVTVGVVGAFNDQWDAVNENLAAQNIRVELVPFLEGSLVNPALADGEIDLNAFQNVGFFNQQVADHGFELSYIGYTFISPMSVFAGPRLDVEPDATRQSLVGLIPYGARIGVPNNVTNLARALRVLEAAGLITIDPAAGYLVSDVDIVDNPYNIEIFLVEASTLVSLLPDLDAAVVNAPQALTGNLSPISDSIFREDALNLPNVGDLVNILVARSDEVNNPVFQAVLAAYQQANVAEIFATNFEGAFVPAWD